MSQHKYNEAYNEGYKQGREAEHDKLCKNCFEELSPLDKMIFLTRDDCDFCHPPLTNQQMLATISVEEFYDKIMWLLHEYGKRYTDSRIAIIEWLNSEVKA